MSENGIAWLPTKQARQIAKLDLAAQKRGESYDIDLLPTKYDGNNLVNNPNVGGLQPHRPWTAGSPPPSGNDFGFTGDQNMWIINGGFNAGSTFSDPAPTNPAYTYPDNSYTGKTYNFDGTSYMIGTNLSIGGAWQSNTITIDFWFYPTANGIQLLTELGQPQLNAYYHTTLLEISNTGNIKARFWQIGGGLAQVITSTNTVDLNAWNHIYFTEDSIGGHSFKLNNVATTGLPSYTRATPLINSNNSIHYAVGGSDTTNMGNNGGFQGKIGYLNIHDYPVGSTWTNTKARFRPTTYSVSIRSYNSGTNTPGNVITTCNEGDTIYIQVDWTSLTVPAGLDSYLQLGGANITDQDMTVMGPVNATDPIPFGSDTGYIVASGGTTGTPILINADSTTEGNETLTWKWYVNSSVVASATCTIVDTSQDPGPSFNQVISLNPNYIVTNGGTSIPNDTDEGSTSATVVGAFTSSSAQGGSITLTDATTSAVYLPAKNIKTIGMWIKIINQQAATQYLLDSRERDGPNVSLGTGYFYTGGYEGWTLMSINGNPADNSLWSTVANNTNVWQYVTLINQTNTPHSITLFNRFSLLEGLATIQVGRIEAWDYIQLDSQIADAYATHSSNYV